MMEKGHPELTRQERILAMLVEEYRVAEYDLVEREGETYARMVANVGRKSWVIDELNLHTLAGQIDRGLR
ncbi:hypothetical protein PDO_1911 [Rhizobium sp. PDO1-076]|uniref:hypothetical protein n=1 Tax=Rhizobium sp. PDO1-076 TaxID=1125979 RepID=UPI00024E35D8|nr:hypothetical protein [Rhizobium sp. PDO1-076]EHS51520.1 hypothetical protein PDO_1911 [Rhizobium sp. PDO1-076]